MPAHLPNPRWTETPEQCVACGYNLTGLPAPGRCPECGAPFDANHLVLVGVPRRTGGGSPVRRLAWITLTVASVVYFQAWGFLFVFNWIASLLIGICLLIGLVTMLFTSRRERRGTERFVLGPFGIASLPREDARDNQAPDAALLSWKDADGFELKRVSSVWYRLRIWQVGRDGSKRNVLVFHAGVRCPDADAANIRAFITAHLTRAHADGTTPVVARAVT